MLNIFNQTDLEILIGRIHKLTPTTQPLWGKMNVAQMLAHCNIIPFELMYEGTRPRPNLFIRLVMKWLVKPTAAGNKPYKKNSATGPDFKITSEKNFEVEKERLITYLIKTQQLGPEYFRDKESPFGKLTETEWKNLFFKHLNHHLTQFGV